MGETGGRPEDEEPDEKVEVNVDEPDAVGGEGKGRDVEGEMEMDGLEMGGQGVEGDSVDGEGKVRSLANEAATWDTDDSAWLEEDASSAREDWRTEKKALSLILAFGICRID